MYLKPLYIPQHTPSSNTIYCILSHPATQSIQQKSIIILQVLDNMTNVCALYNLIKFMLLKKSMEYLICISFVAVILKYLNIPAFCSNAHGAFDLVLQHSIQL
jgi:hypothetical protein